MTWAQQRIATNADALKTLAALAGQPGDFGHRLICVERGNPPKTV
jgi:hypothetical protein